MTDITASDIRPSINHTRWPRIRLSKLSLGSMIAAMPAAMGQAYGMALIAPYQGGGRQPSRTADPDLQGRDPNW